MRDKYSIRTKVFRDEAMESTLLKEKAKAAQARYQSSGSNLPDRKENGPTRSKDHRRGTQPKKQSKYVSTMIEFLASVESSRGVEPQKQGRQPPAAQRLPPRARAAILPGRSKRAFEGRDSEGKAARGGLGEARNGDELDQIEAEARRTFREKSTGSTIESSTKTNNNINKQLVENKLVDQLLRSPDTKIDNTVLLLADTLVSNNRYVFELLRENGFLSPELQTMALSFINEVDSQSKQLHDVLMGARRRSSSMRATRVLVISCMTQILSVSNRFTGILDRGCKSVAAPGAAGAATNDRAPKQSESREPIGAGALDKYVHHTMNSDKRILASLISDIVSKRKQVSSALAETFQKVMQNENVLYSDLVAKHITEDLKNTIQFLTDPERLSTFLSTANTLGTADAPIQPTRRAENNLVNHSMTDASSFLDFIDTSGLSVIFTEDEEVAAAAGKASNSMRGTRSSLDTILERMNLKLSKRSSHKRSNSQSSFDQKNKSRDPTKNGQRGPSQDRQVIQHQPKTNRAERQKPVPRDSGTDTKLTSTMAEF